MKKLITLVTILTPNLLFSQIEGGLRFYISSQTSNHQTIIYFANESTDEADNCCDALSIGNFSTIWTEINQVQYVINSFSPLFNDRFISLGVRCPSQIFEIGIDEIYQQEIKCKIYDSLTNEMYDLPHQFNGPTDSDSRFQIFFEYPLNITLNNKCGYTQVIIDDDSTVGNYYLSSNGLESEITDDSINIYSNGLYQLSIDGDTINESVNFNIQNISNNYQSILNIPFTEISILDPGIIPTVQSNYNPQQIIWNFGDGNFVYDDSNPVHFYQEPGVYNLTCTVISPEGCVEILTSVITVFTISGFEPIIRKDRKYLYTYGIDGKLLKKY